MCKLSLSLYKVKTRYNLGRVFWLKKDAEKAQYQPVLSVSKYMVYISNENSPDRQKYAILKFNHAEINCWVFEDKKNLYIINY